MKKKLKRRLLGVALLLCFVMTGCSGRVIRDYSDSNNDVEETLNNSEITSDNSDSNYEAEKVSDNSYSDYEEEEDLNNLMGLKTAGFVTSTVMDSVSHSFGDAVSHSVENAVSASVSGFTKGIFEDLMDDIKDDVDNEVEIDKIYEHHEKEKTSTDNFTLKDVTAKSFQADIDLGNINISYSNDNTATIKAKYIASGKNKDVLSEILQTVGIDYSIKGDTLQVSVVNKNTKKNIWNWMNAKHKHYNLCVELDITLPKSINEFDIDNSLGEIILNSLKGAFNIDNSLGNVNLCNVEFVGKSKIKLAMGDIGCSLSKELKENSEVTMDNSMGNIDIDMKSLPYTVDKKDDWDDYWDDSASRSIKVKKLCDMNLNVDMGEIDIR